MARSSTRTAGNPRRAGAVVCLALLGVVAPAAQPAQAGLISNVLGTTTTLVGGVTGALLGGSDWAYTAEPTTVRDAATAVRADTMWRYGYTGKGVGVALIDTGVAPVKGLTSGNVLNGPDLSFESQTAGAEHVDGFGHGTHMAGIIAGRDSVNGSGYRGIAPDATLLSVKVGVSNGATDVSQVVAAVDWVVAHRIENHTRVLNLSYGTDSTQPYGSDPLAHAVENAWRAGIVVVVSGGNRGSNQPRVDSPASDPYVLAVGADDILGTPDSTTDDAVPAFSTRGSSARSVDVVAPGQSIASLRAPGSQIDTSYPDAVVDSRYFKGSGTSQAAAVVSGTVALLLQQRPQLTPDQVKRLLKSTASLLPTADLAGQGAGLVNVYAASRALTPTTAQTWARSTGLGSLEAARGTAHVYQDDTELTGEQDIFGTPWDASGWAARSTAGTAWTDGTWNGTAWTGTCWCDSSWSGAAWSGKIWSGAAWSGKIWSGSAWSGKIWSGSAWSGSAWSAAEVPVLP
jgi:serine protease AprX